MNLIEQLGGYEKAKSALKWIEKNNPVHDWMKPILESQFLEHRRAHNIFEEGDYITHDGELKVFAMWSNAIDGCAYIGYAYAEDGEMAHKDEFRHASDEEIKAGKRLEVKSEN